MEFAFLDKYLSHYYISDLVVTELDGNEINGVFMASALNIDNSSLLKRLLEAKRAWTSQDTIEFLEDYPFLPVVISKSSYSAISYLNKKLSMLFDDYPSPKFKILAHFDNNRKDTYSVTYDHIFDDIMKIDDHMYWYECIKKECSPTHKRNLYALFNYQFGNLLTDDIKVFIND